MARPCSLLRVALLILLASLAGCQTLPSALTPQARTDELFRCASDWSDPARSRCIDQFLEEVGADKGGAGRLQFSLLAGDLGTQPELRSAWPDLSDRERSRPGAGVPVILSSASNGRTLPEGVFRSGVVLRDPAVPSQYVVHDTCPQGQGPCALHPMAGFRAWRSAASPLWRGIVAALRPVKGFEAAHAHLLTPNAAPDALDVVLIHGLASNPGTWEPMLEAMIQDPTVLDATRIWLVTYPSSTPILVNRLRVSRALQEARAWHHLPEGPWRGVVIGHSLGGVLARQLAIDPKERLLTAAFRVPWSEMSMRPGDRADVEALLDFHPVFDCGTVISIAAPFYGAPGTVAWPARVLTSLQLRVTPELRSLRRVAQRNETNVAPELRESYLAGLLSSLTTLQPGQPVIRAAADTALPPPVRHVAIAGVGRRTAGEDGDRVVTAKSALHPLADERLPVPGGHDVHRSAVVAQSVLDEVTRLIAQGRCIAAQAVK